MKIQTKAYGLGGIKNVHMVDFGTTKKFVLRFGNTRTDICHSLLISNLQILLKMRYSGLLNPMFIKWPYVHRR